MLEVLAGGAIDEASLPPCVGFRSDRYARRLVHRSDLLDVMVSCPCFDPEQRTCWRRELAFDPA